MITDPLLRYSDVASCSASAVISKYSTSFSLACRLLEPGTRSHIENIYALVRVADEAVDGAATAAGLSTTAVAEQLDLLEAETLRAMACGYSTNLVVHAFARSARTCGITSELTAPFFASMRSDLSISEHSPASLDGYIYGSAEVVGLMCLRAFQILPDADHAHEQELRIAARRLGAAFQKVNFLRDLAADSEDLGRSYFPDTVPAMLTEERKAELVAEIRADLDYAATGIVRLPPSVRRAVGMTHDLFRALVLRIERVPASDLLRTRVRVGGPRKALIAARALTRRFDAVPVKRVAA
ncbi:phytoene/squalene synthase family protein [Paeniglutamicibacter cryotolerans]|uniref:Phytoene/squalene synthetase n=1 Tax=Paeniglutamicibacter cryotolerans TaxID=670079 RepID=A0A839QRB3_9MICC|nr:squalene/phytoene synthase family protein [Paeniglutamicibacter cryotolerans]MBB2994611.1 phytoene/squalene synthetase [Paeniglutamicibacter cryotolerans]